VAIRNTYLERTDSHGHKCPRNDNVVGRYTKFEHREKSEFDVLFLL
jgi:hypothetical protein